MQGLHKLSAKTINPPLHPFLEGQWGGLPDLPTPITEGIQFYYNRSDTVLRHLFQLLFELLAFFLELLGQRCKLIEQRLDLLLHVMDIL